MKKIHEQYGDYNPAVEADHLEADRTTHNDVLRQTTKNVAHMEEFEKGQLICRQYAPLASALCTEAGMQVFRVSGYSNDLHVSGMKVELEGAPEKSGHIFVVSRLTGNVIEASTDGEHIYRRMLNNQPIEAIIAGHTILAQGRDGHIDAYGTGYAEHLAQEVVLAKREEKVATRQLYDMPFFDIKKYFEKYDDFSKTVGDYYKRWRSCANSPRGCNLSAIALV